MKWFVRVFHWQRNYVISEQTSIICCCSWWYWTLFKYWMGIGQLAFIAETFQLLTKSCATLNLLTMRGNWYFWNFCLKRMYTGPGQEEMTWMARLAVNKYQSLFVLRQCGHGQSWLCWLLWLSRDITHSQITMLYWRTRLLAIVSSSCL